MKYSDAEIDYEIHLGLYLDLQEAKRRRQEDDFVCECINDIKQKYCFCCSKKIKKGEKYLAVHDTHEMERYVNKILCWKEHRRG